MNVRKILDTTRVELICVDPSNSLTMLPASAVIFLRVMRDNHSTGFWRMSEGDHGGERSIFAR